MIRCELAPLTRQTMYFLTLTADVRSRSVLALFIEHPEQNTDKPQMYANISSIYIYEGGGEGRGYTTNIPYNEKCYTRQKSVHSKSWSLRFLTAGQEHVHILK